MKDIKEGLKVVRERAIVLASIRHDTDVVRTGFSGLSGESVLDDNDECYLDLFCWEFDVNFEDQYHNKTGTYTIQFSDVVDEESFDTKREELREEYEKWLLKKATDREEQEEKRKREQKEKDLAELKRLKELYE